jgi:hypothetical protein
MNERITIWVDGPPLREVPLGSTVEVLLADGTFKRISGDWVLYCSHPGMYHVHGQNLVGCLKGSRVCMECGQEWPKDLEGFINLRQSGLR